MLNIYCIVHVWAFKLSPTVCLQMEFVQLHLALAEDIRTKKCSSNSSLSKAIVHLLYKYLLSTSHKSKVYSLCDFNFGARLSKTEGFSSKNALIGYRSLCSRYMPKPSRLEQLPWNTVLHRTSSICFKFLTYFSLRAGMLTIYWHHIRTVFLRTLLIIHNSIYKLISSIAWTIQLDFRISYQ